MPLGLCLESRDRKDIFLRSEISTGLDASYWFKIFRCKLFLSHLGLFYPLDYPLVSKAVGGNVGCHSLKVFLTEVMAIFVLIFY